MGVPFRVQPFRVADPVFIQFLAPVWEFTPTTQRLLLKARLYENGNPAPALVTTGIAK
jgi:hypothetical protein